MSGDTTTKSPLQGALRDEGRASERVAIRVKEPPPGENIPVSVEPFPVDDSIPTEDYIK